MNDAVRVLHVDDDPTFVELVAASIEATDEAVSVESAVGVEAGLERLESGEFDCIVSDYNMPGATGIEFLQTVRETDSDIPFILFTGKGSEAVASDAISAGVTDYLQKGTVGQQFELLTNRIRNAVAQYRNQRAQQLLLELAENTDQVLFIYTAEYSELLFVSAAYERVWGRPMATLGADSTDLVDGVHPDDRDAVTDALSLVAGGESVEVEFRVNATDDSDRWLQLRCEPITDETGAVVRVAGFGVDITERYRRRERRDRQRDTLLELATDEAVTGGALDSALHRITETAATVLSVPRVNVWFVEEHEGDEVLRCADHYDAVADEHTSGMSIRTDTYPAYLAALETNRAIAVTDARADPRTAGLTEGYLDVHGIGALLDGTLRSEGAVIGVICHEAVGGPREWTDDEIEYASDIADIVHRAVRNHEQREREMELRRTSARIERQNRRLEEFTSVVSHDLRNPLAVARGHLALARDDCDSRHLDDVNQAHERMSALVNDLLSLARGDDDQLPVEPVDLGELSGLCWRNVEHPDATLVTDTERTVLANRGRLQQLVENLMRNAVEHSDGAVTVRVGDLDDDTGFYVEDDGPGIPPKARETVFQAGYSTLEGGTGFGLSIVQQVAERHGWGVQVTGGTSGGARFELMQVADASE